MAERGRVPGVDPAAGGVPDQVRRPRNALAGRYGHPSHAAMVAAPIGAFLAAAVFDIASHLTRTGTAAALATGATWLLGIGVLTGLAAATTGFVDLLGIPGGTRTQRTALLHAGANVTALGVLAVDLILRLAQPPPGPVPLAFVVLTLVGLAFLGSGGFLGGELAFHYGVRVADEATQATGYRSRPATGSAPHTPDGTA